MAADILLVEDNQTEALLTLRALNKAGSSHQIHVARDGAEALDFIFARGKHASCQEMPKLILLDINLPKINGLEVLKQLKNDSHTSLIPVIILTNSIHPYDVELAHQYGADNYIQKPLDLDECVKLFRHIIAHWL